MPVTAVEDLTWMDPIIQYLKDGTVPYDKNAASKLQYRAVYYTLVGDKLYKKGYFPYLRCLGPVKADYVLREIHEGVCRNFTAGRSLSHKVVRQGYLWPTLSKDAKEFARKCDRCQRFGSIPRQPSESLTSVSSP